MKENNDFIKEIEKETGQSISICYQCKKCAAGCPVVYEMDYTPTQIIHLIHLGQKEQVLNSRSIWLCMSCNTCTTRCPQKVDIAKIMDAGRIITIREKIKPSVKSIHSFNTSVLQTIRIFGRLYEVGMLMLVKLKTRELTKDIGLGVKMLVKGKLKLFPDFINVIETNKIFSRIRKIEKEKI